jgi:taurine--2-oxoglutarate transaminase
VTRRRPDPFYVNVWSTGTPDMRRARRANTYVAATGLSVVRADGRRFEDWGGQYFVNNVGTGRADVARALAAQARRMSWISPTEFTDIRLALTADLRTILPAGVTTPFFTVGGSDAIESAIRAARKVTGRRRVLAFGQSYHGDTMTVESVNGGPITKYGDPRPWTVRTPGPYDLWESSGHDWPGARARAIDRLEATLRRLGPRTFACIIVEPVMGSAGCIPIDRGMARRLRSICDRFGILLVADEVVTGFGRTGRWFGSQTVGLRPDALVIAKGMTGGYAPLGAVVFGGSWAGELRRTGLNHGLTFAGHPIGCAAARAVIRILKRDRLVERADADGRFLRAGLEDLQARHPGVISDVRGIGMFQAFQVRPGRESSERRVERIAAAALRRGARLLPASDGRVFLFSPPLNVGRPRIRRLLGILDDAIRGLVPSAGRSAGRP